MGNFHFMKVSKHDRNNIVIGMLPFLKPDVYEPATEVFRGTGSDLIARGMARVDGVPIDPFELYRMDIPTKVKINHARRLLGLIDQAKDEAQLVDLISDYQCRYGIAAPSKVEAMPDYKPSKKKKK